MFLDVPFDTDTIAMTLSFEPEKTAVLATLRIHHATLTAGSHLPHAEARSIADKLGWYAQVLQADRLHVRSSWLYVVFGSRLLASSRARLQNTSRWIDVLLQWSDAWNKPQRFLLLTAHTFWMRITLEKNARSTVNSNICRN